jgi:hypothetical protein
MTSAFTFPNGTNKTLHIINGAILCYAVTPRPFPPRKYGGRSNGRMFHVGLAEKLYRGITAREAGGAATGHSYFCDHVQNPTKFPHVVICEDFFQIQNIVLLAHFARVLTNA